MKVNFTDDAQISGKAAQTMEGSAGKVGMPRFTHSLAFRRAALQASAAAALLLFGWFLIQNLSANLNSEGIAIDFGFLSQESGFDVNESLLPYTASDSYGDALMVGLVNTLHLTFVCIVLSTVIGLAIGFARRSGHWLVNRSALVYVETMRNLPKLLILLAVYVLLVRELPMVRDAWSFYDLAYLSNRGFQVPVLSFPGSAPDAAYAVLAALLALSLLLLVLARFYPALPGVGLSTRLTALAAVCVFPAFMIGYMDVGIEVPRFEGFNFVGGATVSIPFLALTIALSIYHGGQIGEVVRGGIQSVPDGQTEAGYSLGLRWPQIAWLIVLPQALRTIIPPLTNQYLNLMKNTSIGLAVGYSDLVSVMNTSVNQTFRPVELMLLTMAIYLAIGLSVSALLNLYNRAVQFKEN